LSPELFQSFGPILNRSRAAGSGREKIQYIGIILILQEPESLADLSVWLSVRERPVDARNGPVSGKLVCRCIVVGFVFVVVLNFRLLPLSSPVVDASLYDEKRKKLLWTVELWRIVLMHYTPILFFSFFVENVENKYNNRSWQNAVFHDSTNPQQQSVNVSSPSL
jgi:hypothetical protein